MLLGHTSPLLPLLREIARRRVDVAKASLEGSADLVRDLTPDEIRDRWSHLVADRTRKGISRLIPSREGFVDHTVHHQDIRRALDRPRTIPEDRLIAALDGVASISSPVFAPKKTVKGLRLEATDVPWIHGDGPVVRGPGEAVLMAAAGRTDALDDLEGDGVAALRERLAA
jgi:uncharacterized protein (TIGR03083 family)